MTQDRPDTIAALHILVSLPGWNVETEVADIWSRRMSAIHWIYPTSHRSDFYVDGPDGPTEVTPDNLLRSVNWQPDKIHHWQLSTGYKGMQPGAMVWAYAVKPRQSIYGLAVARKIRQDEAGWCVELVWNAEATRILVAEPIHRSLFVQVAQRPAIRANGETAKVLDAWLHTHQV